MSTSDRGSREWVSTVPVATVWSLDARVLVRPASSFGSIGARAAGGRVWTACRRPLVLTVVLACIVSLLASGTLTLRLVLSASTYWVTTPLAETLALAIVLGRRRDRVGLPRAIDLFFAGHAPWTLLLLAIAASLAFLRPDVGWRLLIHVWPWFAILAIAWSAYIDVCFFRAIVGANRATAVRDVVVLRLLTWTAVVAIFAWPSMTPDGLADMVSTILGG